MHLTVQKIVEDLLAVFAVAHFFHLCIEEVLHFGNEVGSNPEKLFLENLHICERAFVHDINSKIVFNENLRVCIINLDMVDSIQVFHGGSGNLFLLGFIPVILDKFWRNLSWLPKGCMEPR